MKKIIKNLKKQIAESKKCLLAANETNFDYKIGILLSENEATEILKALQGLNKIGCKCKESEKHGKTSIMCCNHCGKPTEKFWNNK